MWAAQGEVVSNHDELMCNFFAQADALAMGKTPIELRAQVGTPITLPSTEGFGMAPSDMIFRSS